MTPNTKAEQCAALAQRSRLASVCFLICSAALSCLFLYGGNKQRPVTPAPYHLGNDDVQFFPPEAQLKLTKQIDAIEEYRRRQQESTSEEEAVTLDKLLKIKRKEDVVPLLRTRDLNITETIWVPSPPENLHQLIAK